MAEALTVADGREASVFDSQLPVAAKLERARTELLDLSARNRLLNMPRSGKTARIIEIIDEKSVQVLRLLVSDQKALTFLAGRAGEKLPAATDANGDPVDDPDDDDGVIAELAQPEDEGIDASGNRNRHVDTRLQTRLTPQGLQKRLLDMYHDARTLEEEQGVNILFLALGTLRWVDPSNAKNTRHAPLLLIPVALERGNAAEKFKLRWRQEEVASNLSLEAFLARVHGITLPPFEGGDDLDLSRYVEGVREAVSAKPDWSVETDDIVLGFFSFAKFLMYRDLDPELWPAEAKLSEHQLIKPLLADGFQAGEPLLDEDAPMDAHIGPADMVHIVDSDSSQTRAVHEVRRGRDIVIQGPPGCGKSQTIANIIASAIADGKTVLFVAEKMAALEVVKRRLDNTGVGDACLELHSHKANKRAMLEELRRTWELGVPRGEGAGALEARLLEARDRLNDHAERMHTPLSAAELTPYLVVGHLTRLKARGRGPVDLVLKGPAAWTREGTRERSVLVTELAERVAEIGTPAAHVWRGVEIEHALPDHVDRLTRRIGGLVDRGVALRDSAAELARMIERDPPSTFSGLDTLADLARRVASAPEIDAEALASSAWDDDRESISALVATGHAHAELAAQLHPHVHAHAWTTDVTEAAVALADLPPQFPVEGFARQRQISELVPNLLEIGAKTAFACGRDDAPTTMLDARALGQLAERVASVPPADSEAITATVWKTGIERAGDLAAAAQALAEAREVIGDRLAESAWALDATEARRVIAEHGTGFMRYLSGEWRRANRTVRSVLANPKTPTEDQIALLDALIKGRKAAAAIEDDADFGRQAFGSDWRGTKTPPAPLGALVDWMRTLRGDADEARRLAAHRPDATNLTRLADELLAGCSGLQPVLEDSWRDTRGTAVASTTPDEAGLLETAARARRIVEAGDVYSSFCKSEPTTIGAMREIMDALRRGQAAKAAIGAAEPTGRLAFGAVWEGADSDWGRTTTIVDWIGSNGDIRELAARVADRRATAELADRTTDDRDAVVLDIQALGAELRATSTSAIDVGRVPDLQIATTIVALVAWRDGAESLSKWVAYRSRAKLGAAMGLAELADALHDGALAPDEAADTFDMAYYTAVFADMVRLDGELAHFDGDLHSRQVASFADLDRQRIRQSALDVARAHHRRIPPAAGGAVGPLGVLKGEIARKRGHMPIRQLIQRAAPAVQALKPVFMMSPLSVAQFLPPGALTFDLLVMDEASQIQPVDALGAIARARQVVVVGDPKQLPPTAFFSKMTGGSDDGDDDGTTKVADIESILGLFTARGLPTRMLRWHYRSRHESLIAVSNREFYENKLYIVPSPYTSQGGMGLRFHHITDGVFDSGATRVNAIEAKVVAKAIIAHAAATPDLSLGVVAFSVAQRRAILDQLEVLRRALPPEHEAFFQRHPAEPFFVKNLENVQGDERDVILISVGYGPITPGGRPPMRFGPVGTEGGERRLNVLISRAKRRCEVFASMTDEDIEPDFASTRKGVYALKTFMHYARTGRMTMAEVSGRDEGSVFEEQVAEALGGLGYQVQRQVGIAGFFIDLAISDPERSDRYVLGIECDGASYHGARSARDRDRLRQTILEDHGWIMHRIWSTDWFRRPKGQLDLTVSAIEAAKAELAARGTAAARTPLPFRITELERGDVTEIGIGQGPAVEEIATPYLEAIVVRPPHLTCDLHEAPTGAVTMLVEHVVGVEGPVHVDEVVARIRDAWGARRAGSRIKESIERAAAVAIRQKRLAKDGEFLSVPGRDAKARDRSSAASASLRKPECLPPAEVAAAVLDVARRNFGATEDQAVLAVSRAFGIKATSAQTRAVITNAIAKAIAEEQLVRREGLIELGPNAPAPMTRPSVDEGEVEALIGAGEGQRVEFKQTLRWDVVQGVPNRKLEDVVVKTIAAFANTVGGTLLIGVKDDGEVIGIDADVGCLGGDLDKFELHLTTLLGKHFNQAFNASRIKVRFPSASGMTVCRIDVERARTEVYVTTADRNGVAAERFFVRTGNSTQELRTSEIATYVAEHFPR